MQVIRVIAQQLGLNEHEIKPESTFEELNIDSLDLIEIAMALEDELGIEIADQDAEKWTTIGDILAHVGNPDPGGD